MNIWDIVKNVGTGVISTLPGGSLILSAVNAMLPVDGQLPDSTTGEGLGSAISELPPDKQAEILSKEFDVDITQIEQSNSTLRTMLESDSNNPHSTRPRIALGAFQVVAFTIVSTISVWSYGVFQKDAELVKAVTDGWPFVIAVIGPLVSLLWAYFGVLKHEHRDRLNAVTGRSGGVVNAISSLLKR